MRIRLIAGLLSLIGTLACGARFDVQLPPRVTPVDARSGAVAAGVQVIIDTNEWRGQVLREVVPIQVSIENESGRLLQVCYQEFALITSSGQHLPALPLFDLTEKVSALPRSYRFPWNGFYVAPHMGRYFRGFWSGRWTFAHDPGPYETRYRRLRDLVEPSADMAASALPEGVLESGGRITGFLYFPALDAPQATFAMQLVDAESRSPLAGVRIPVLARLNEV